MPSQLLVSRRFSIAGKVQGVGFRDFAQREARTLGLTGYARNLPDGSVLVCATGTAPQVDQFEGILRRGPRWAEVRGFATEESGPVDFDDFRIVG